MIQSKFCVQFDTKNNNRIFFCPQTIVFLNQRLVDEGFAEWVSLDDTPYTQVQHQPQDSLEGAVGGIEVA